MTVIVDSGRKPTTESHSGAAEGYLFPARGAVVAPSDARYFISMTATAGGRVYFPKERSHSETPRAVGVGRPLGLEKVRSRIQEFVSAGEGWGFGTEKAVSWRAGYRAIDVARRLSKRLGAMPKTFPTSAGEIVLSWSTPGNDVEVYVPERGPMSALVETPSESTEFVADDAITIEARLPR